MRPPPTHDYDKDDERLLAEGECTGTRLSFLHATSSRTGLVHFVIRSQRPNGSVVRVLCKGASLTALRRGLAAFDALTTTAENASASPGRPATAPEDENATTSQPGASTGLPRRGTPRGSTTPGGR